MDGVKIDNREDEEDISDDEEDSNNNIMLEGLQEGSGPSLDNWESVWMKSKEHLLTVRRGKL